MRLLKENQLTLITGASRNGGWEGYWGHSGGGASKKNSSSKGGGNGGGFYAGLGDAVTDCNNNILAGLGMGAFGGVPGMAAGVALGALAGGCFKSEGGNGGGGGSGSNASCSGDSCSR